MLFFKTISLIKYYTLLNMYLSYLWSCHKWKGYWTSSVNLLLISFYFVMLLNSSNNKLYLATRYFYAANNWTGPEETTFELVI